METVSDKNFAINSLRFGTKSDRDKILRELFAIDDEQHSCLELNKLDLLKILQFCFYTHDKDGKQLFVIMERINPNLGRADLVLRFDNPEPLLTIFEQEKRQNI